MAHVFISIPLFVASGRKCPVCLGEVEIIGITDKCVHVSCPLCTWAELACCVYGMTTEEASFIDEARSPVHPY